MDSKGIELMAVCVPDASPEQAQMLKALVAAKSPSALLQAGRHVLESLHDRATDFEIRASMVLDFLDDRHVWAAPIHAYTALHGHGLAIARAMPTREDFLKSLGPQMSDMITRGTSSAQAQRAAIKTIERCWGQDWWDNLPKDLLTEHESRAALNLTKRTIQGIAAIAAESADMLEAVDCFRGAIQERLDEAALPAGERRRCFRAATLKPPDLRRTLAAIKDGSGPSLAARAPRRTKRKRLTLSESIIGDDDDCEKETGRPSGRRSEEVSDSEGLEAPDQAPDLLVEESDAAPDESEDELDDAAPPAKRNRGATMAGGKRRPWENQVTWAGKLNLGLSPAEARGWIDRCQVPPDHCLAAWLASETRSYITQLVASFQTVAREACKNEGLKGVCVGECQKKVDRALRFDPADLSALWTLADEADEEEHVVYQGDEDAAGAAARERFEEVSNDDGESLFVN
jgi:hypothetical protein